MFKFEEEKNTWKKIYFCTKVILSPAYVLCSFPFLLWAVVYIVEHFSIFRLEMRGIAGFGTFGNRVAFTLPFSTPSMQDGQCLLTLYIFLCLF